MFKKTLYPFTDWNWLKLPLASLVVGALMMMLAVATLGSLLFHKDHPEAAVSSIVVTYLAAYLMFGLLYFAYFGYLLRVARQPQAEEPLKLPPWSKPGTLIKDGFLATFAYVLLMYAAGGLFGLGFGVFGGSLATFLEVTGLAQWISDWTHGGLLAIVMFCGTMALILAVLFCFYVWFAVFVPILFVRYAYTGKMRHVFSPRWAWRAITIAPVEYLGRSSAWTIYLAAITILTPLTAGVAYFIGMLLMPLAMINVAYLLGDYYAIYLDD